MSDNSVNLSRIVDFVDFFSRETYFIDKSDEKIFQALKNLYSYLHDQTGSWVYLIKICALYKKRYKKITAEVKSFALRAIEIGSHPDAVVYYGLAVVKLDR